MVVDEIKWLAGHYKETDVYVEFMKLWLQELFIF